MQGCVYLSVVVLFSVSCIFLSHPAKVGKVAKQIDRIENTEDHKYKLLSDCVTKIENEVKDIHLNEEKNFARINGLHTSYTEQFHEVHSELSSLNSLVTHLTNTVKENTKNLVSLADKSTQFLKEYFLVISKVIVDVE